MARYRFGRIETEAIQWDGTEKHAREIMSWCEFASFSPFKEYVPYHGRINQSAVIRLMEPNDIISRVYPGDYIAKNDDGTFTMYDRELFEYAFEPCE